MGKIKEKSAEKGYTLTSLAIKLNTATSNVYGWDKDKRMPNRDNKNKLCSILECDISDIFDIESVVSSRLVANAKNGVFLKTITSNSLYIAWLLARDDEYYTTRKIVHHLDDVKAFGGYVGHSLELGSAAIRRLYKILGEYNFEYKRIRIPGSKIFAKAVSLKYSAFNAFMDHMGLTPDLWDKFFAFAVRSPMSINFTKGKPISIYSLFLSSGLRKPLIWRDFLIYLRDDDMDTIRNKFIV